VLERFSDESQKVVVVAYQEARLLGHRFVGTEHILLGLFGDRDGIAGRVLAFVGVSQDQARDEIVGIVGSIEEPSTELLFSPRAKALLEVALRQALQSGSTSCSAWSTMRNAWAHRCLSARPVTELRFTRRS
jgi:ATP-dependent Clp protease ATP-binding subunit ClpC